MTTFDDPSDDVTFLEWSFYGFCDCTETLACSSYSKQDPMERNRFLNLLSSIGRDVTVILSTHIVDDVRELCPRMAIIANGQLLLEGSPSETLAALNGKIWSKIVETDDELRALESQMHVISGHLVDGKHEVRVFADASPAY